MVERLNSSSQISSFCSFTSFTILSLYVSGVVVYEYELKIGWGKSVALPAQALPAPPPGHMAIRNKEVLLLFLSFLYQNHFLYLLQLVFYLIICRNLFWLVDSQHISTVLLAGQYCHNIWTRWSTSNNNSKLRVGR